MLGMNGEDQAGVSEAIKMIRVDLEELVEGMNEQDLSGRIIIQKHVTWLRREQMKMDDPIMSRELDRLLEEVAKMLNDVEGEYRRREDENWRHQERCKTEGQFVKHLVDKFKEMEKQI
jgi:hypothetical protein